MPNPTDITCPHCGYEFDDYDRADFYDAEQLKGRQNAECPSCEGEFCIENHILSWMEVTRIVAPAALNLAVAESAAQCEGGQYCTCHEPGCACGCRNDCRVFRMQIQAELEKP